jgi:hypothetical protein
MLEQGKSRVQVENARRMKHSPCLIEANMNGCGRLGNDSAARNRPIVGEAGEDAIKTCVE